MINATKNSISPKINTKATVPVAKLDLTNRNDLQSINISRVNSSRTKNKPSKNENEVSKGNIDIVEKKNSKSTPTNNTRYTSNNNLEINESDKLSNIKSEQKANKLLSDKTNLKEVSIKNIDVNIFRKSLNSQDITISNNNTSIKYKKDSKILKEETDVIFNKINQKLKQTNKKANQISLKKSSESPAFVSPKIHKIDSTKKLNLNFLKNKNNNFAKSLKIKEKDSITSPKSILSGSSPKINRKNLAQTDRKIDFKSSKGFKDLNCSIKFEHNRQFISELKSPKGIFPIKKDKDSQISQLISEGNIINSYVLTEVQAQSNSKNKQKSYEKSIEYNPNKDSFKLSQNINKLGNNEKKLSSSHEIKYIQPEFFQNVEDIDSKLVIILDKVKHEIYTNSDNRIKQYGLLFQFISSNLKEINEMVNMESNEPPKIQLNYLEDKKKIRNKEEELKSGLLNKIDEVSSNKVSSMSSLKIPISKKDSNELNNSSNINSNSQLNDNKFSLFSKKKRENLSKKIINNSKLSNNISSINSDHLKNIIEDSVIIKGYSDEISSIKSQDEKFTKNSGINKIKSDFFNKSKTDANFHFNLYFNNEHIGKNKENTVYNESIDSDKTKERFPLNKYDKSS